MVQRTLPKFETGNQVYLLSGSCRMVIEKIEDDLIHCVWQNYETKEIQRGEFQPHVLSKATP